MGRLTLENGGAVNVREAPTWPFQNPLISRNILRAMMWRSKRFEVQVAGWLILLSASVAWASERASGEPWWAGSIPGYMTAGATLLGGIALVIRAVKAGRSARREAMSEEMPRSDSGAINSRRLKAIEDEQEAYEERRRSDMRDIREHLTRLDISVGRLAEKVYDHQQWSDRVYSEITKSKDK